MDGLLVCSAIGRALYDVPVAPVMHSLVSIESTLESTVEACRRAGWSATINAQHGGVNGCCLDVLLRARRFRECDVIVFTNECAATPLLDLWNAAGECFVARTVNRSAWAVTRRNLGVIIMEWCPKRRDDYWWCIDRSRRQRGARELVLTTGG